MPLRTRSTSALALLLAACSTVSPTPEAVEPVPTATSGDRPGARPSPVRPPVAQPDPVRSRSDAMRSWAEETLAGMTLRQKVGQLMMPFVLGDYAPRGTGQHDRVSRWIEQEEIGGLIVSVGSPTDVAVKLNDFQTLARVPLLIAADLETGAGFRLSGAIHSPTNIVLGGATNFPNLMAVGAAGDAELARQMGRITGREALAVGIHVPFAPVLDVNNNPDNPIINVRSFGENPERVSELGAAFVGGIQEMGAIATGKHFPGHGDTDVDSHIGLPVIRASRERMDSVELEPFRAAIDVGLGGMMTAHITVPSLNGGGELPSTLSSHVLTDLLREQLGFRGLVFTDAMDMGAIDREYGRGEAAVMAIEAGADIILMPPDVRAAIDGIIEAVQLGRLPESRIDASAMKVLRAKERLSLQDGATVPMERIPFEVGIPEHAEVANEIARRSITLLRNERNLLPLLGTRTARVMSVTYRRRNDLLAGRYFNGSLRSVYPRLSATDVTKDSDPEIYNELLEEARSSALVVVSTYVTVVSYSGTVALPEETSNFIEQLAEARIPHIVVSFGNPYLVREFPSTQAYMAAWSGSRASQRAAASALFGEFEITGRSPTRIPPFFEIGDGIRVPARNRGR